METPKKIKIWLSAILISACMFDLITFLVYNLNQFEINPLFILSKSIVLMVAFKLLINFLILWSLWKYKVYKSFRFSYLIILVLLYASFLQCLGASSNIVVSEEYKATVGTEQEIQPMPQGEAIQTFAWFSLILLYLPILLGFISFWIWENIYIENWEEIE